MGGGSGASLESSPCSRAALLEQQGGIAAGVFDRSARARGLRATSTCLAARSMSASRPCALGSHGWARSEATAVVALEQEEVPNVSATMYSSLPLPPLVPVVGRPVPAL
jgi:hypothetical protein